MSSEADNRLEEMSERLNNRAIELEEVLDRESGLNERLIQEERRREFVEKEKGNL